VGHEERFFKVEENVVFVSTKRTKRQHRAYRKVRAQLAVAPRSAGD
jgi:hypothetical protein